MIAADPFADYCRKIAFQDVLAENVPNIIRLDHNVSKARKTMLNISTICKIEKPFFPTTNNKTETRNIMNRGKGKNCPSTDLFLHPWFQDKNSMMILHSKNFGTLSRHSYIHPYP